MKLSFTASNQEPTRKYLSNETCLGKSGSTLKAHITTAQAVTTETLAHDVVYG